MMTQLDELNALKQLGIVPVDIGVLKDVFSSYQSPVKKVQSLVQSGKLLQLKRGLYVVSPQISGRQLSLELVANHLYGPSYVSLHYALRHYGLIPERVYMVTSVTTRHTRSFKNELAMFSYRGVGADYFPIGVRSQEADGISYLIATPEKALCDMLMHERYVPAQSQSALATFFEEDMRIDLEDLRQMDTRTIRACMETGGKKKILNNLLKLIER